MYANISKVMNFNFHNTNQLLEAPSHSFTEEGSNNNSFKKFELGYDNSFRPFQMAMTLPLLTGLWSSTNWSLSEAIN